MINPQLNVILGSQSPRRAELLQLIDVPFTTEVRSVDEVWPDSLDVYEVAAYLAELKASVFDDLQSRDVLITADSVVIVDDQIFGKPATIDEAKTMIRALSGRTHVVVTGVCIATMDGKDTFSDRAVVTMAEISPAEIDYYVSNYSPMDKAGAYGIQEWIGYSKITNIDGTFPTIMGLPVHMVYERLRELGSSL
jgi:septum formation protein